MKQAYRIQPVDKPPWYETKRWLAFRLARLANKIYPQSPEVMAFYLRVAQDSMIMGRSVVQVIYDDGPDIKREES